MSHLYMMLKGNDLEGPYHFTHCHIGHDGVGKSGIGNKCLTPESPLSDVTLTE